MQERRKPSEMRSFRASSVYAPRPPIIRPRGAWLRRGRARARASSGGWGIGDAAEERDGEVRADPSGGERCLRVSRGPWGETTPEREGKPRRCPGPAARRAPPRLPAPGPAGDSAMTGVTPPASLVASTELFSLLPDSFLQQILSASCTCQYLGAGYTVKTRRALGAYTAQGKCTINATRHC